MKLVRSIRSTVVTATTVAGLGLVAFPALAAAQAVLPRPAISVSAGASQFDLSGTGVAPIIAVRADMPLGRIVLVEGGVGFTRPDQQFGSRTTLVVPEVQLQAQLPLGSFMPYLGVGGGIAMDFRPDDVGGTRSDVTASASGGVRWWITPRIGARGELRVRGIGEGFSGSAAEWTGGLAWRF